MSGLIYHTIDQLQIFNLTFPELSTIFSIPGSQYIRIMSVSIRNKRLITYQNTLRTLLFP